MNRKELTILMPCLNEALTIETCIKRARKLLHDNGIAGEILVSDNGSTDGSQQIAERLGARVINCPVRGYGAALQFGIEHAVGVYVLMGDSDDSYHFDEASPMIEKLREGFDVCMGTRLKGRIMPGAMSPLNRYLGNPVLTTIGQGFFKIPTSDFHCGMRAFRNDRICGINLVTTGMEWASEMVIKSKLQNLKMCEVPITLYKDGRERPPHLRRWQDGWRHLRFMLMHTPNWLFIFPGMLLVTLGMLGEMKLMNGIIQIGSAKLDVQTMIVLSFLLIVGVQMLFTGFMADIYSHTSGVFPYTEKYLRSIKGFTLEKLLLLAILVGGVGGLGFCGVLWEWFKTGFGALDFEMTTRQLIPSMALITISAQCIFNGFMLSVLLMPTKSTFNFYGSPNIEDRPISHKRTAADCIGGVK
jgi:glycosyltransferase involved in cell wall biosynthesis